MTRKPRYVKPDAVKELERLADSAARKKYPTMPVKYMAPRKFRDDTANSLTTCITTYLKLKGAFVSRLNNTGIYDRKTGRYRPGTNRKGLPDVMATYQGKSIFIEVKTGRDRLSQAQQQIQQEHEGSGGLYFIARNFTEFKQWLDSYEEKRNK
jgi:hypothetical protein